MKDDMSWNFGFFQGFIAGIIVLIIILAAIPGPSEHKIKECELELPRNQHCELIAVPIEKEKNDERYY